MELNKAYNIDGLELLKQIDDKRIDLILTDPPYILSTKGGGICRISQALQKVTENIKHIANDFDYEAFFSEFLRVCKVPNMLIFCSNKQISRTMRYFEERGLSVTLLTWNKTNTMPNGNKKYKTNAEFIIYVRDAGVAFNNISHNSKVLTYPFPHKDSRIHPTEKPIDLLKLLIARHSNEGDVVLDPFGGSFTTAIASYNLKRNFITTEIDSEMYHKANKRLTGIMSQTKLL